MRFCLFFFMLFCSKLLAQNCSISIEGTVSEIATNHLKKNVYVFIEETNQTIITDDEGRFNFNNLCEGEYHIKTSHLGYESTSQYISINSDTSVEIKIKHFTELLNETIVHGEEVKSLQQSNTLTNEDIVENSNKSIGELLSKIQGVSSLKNGNAISKPIIQGLTGNRVGFITDGVPLSSQQWGNDHPPEIDPFTADHISVVKGVATLEHLSSSANALVIVEPIEIGKEPHLHGGANYIFDTNSRAHTSNFKLSNYNKIVGFSLTSTYKKSGDAKTPDYFLTNTGAEQANFSLRLEKEIKKIKLNASYSYFDTTIGILAGAFSETLAGLESALTLERPSGTRDSFSYNINAPKQEVTHQSFKFGAKYELSPSTEINLAYAFQKNERAEFDNRIGGRLTIPELELEKSTHFIKGSFKTKLVGNDAFKLGAEYQETTNENIFGTQVFPLVPNYNSDELGFFATYVNKKDKWSYELGARINLSSYNVATAIREVQNFQYEYVNLSYAVGFNYQFSHSLNSTLHVGYTRRGALTNELFSFGLHQGVATFERGSFFGEEEFLLEDEKNIKATWALDYHIGEKLFFENLAYVNPIQDYIFLAFNESIFTIRGPLNTADYTQTNALLYGTDLRVVYKPIEKLSLILKYSYLRGEDTSNDGPLTFIPPNNGSLSVDYVFNNGKILKNSKIGLEVSHAVEQDRFVIEQEVVVPPDAYTLLNFSASSKVNIFDKVFNVGLKVDNLTNEVYRNFLNRLRYFADEQGVNFSFRLGYDF